MIRDATFLQTGGWASDAVLVRPTKVLKADQTNWCVDSQQTNVSTWSWIYWSFSLPFTSISVSPVSAILFFLFFFLCVQFILQQAGCFYTFWTFPSYLSLLSLTSIFCFGALFLFPPRLPEPLQRYLPLPICLSSSYHESGAPLCFVHVDERRQEICVV